MTALAHKQDVPVEHAGLTFDELMRIAFPPEQYARIFPVEAAERRERINAAARRIAAAKVAAGYGQKVVVR